MVASRGELNILGRVSHLAARVGLQTQPEEKAHDHAFLVKEGHHLPGHDINSHVRKVGINDQELQLRKDGPAAYQRRQAI